MNSLLARLGEMFLGKKAKPLKTRLSAEQAIEIASAYVKAHGLDLLRTGLVLHEVSEVDGKVIWTLRTPTVGRWLTVGVDDATGEGVGHHVHGVR